jgi:uncharacterized OsmC-like protein
MAEDPGLTHGPFRVVAGAGTCRRTGAGVWTRPHAWTEGGVTIEADLTGAHLLLLSVATCVLNDVYRDARDSGTDVSGVRVEAGGSFDATWGSTGVDYVVHVDSEAPMSDVEALLDRVDEVAEVPRALRRGAEVGRAR